MERALPGVDYIAFGPIFATSNLSSPKASKGLERLRAAADTVAGRVPLVAIGGINASNVNAIHDHGADAWAVIGAIAGATDPVQTTRTFLRVT